MAVPMAARCIWTASRSPHPSYANAHNARAAAYVRPHELEVQRYAPGGNIDAQGRSRGIVARLERAIVVGPSRGWNLSPKKATNRAR